MSIHLCPKCDGLHDPELVGSLEAEITLLCAEVERLTQEKEEFDLNEHRHTIAYRGSRISCQEVRILLERERDEALAQVAVLRQAVGLATTIKPSMVMRPDDPLGMMEEVVAEARALLDRLHALEVSVNLLQEANMRWCESALGNRLQ